MQIKIRDIDPMAIKKIDEEANKKGFSRNHLLKLHIERLAQYDVFLEERNRFEETMQNVMRILQMMTVSMQKNESELSKLRTMISLILEVDENEIEKYADVLRTGVEEN